MTDPGAEHAGADPRAEHVSGRPSCGTDGSREAAQECGVPLIGHLSGSVCWKRRRGETRGCTGRHDINNRAQPTAISASGGHSHESILEF